VRKEKELEKRGWDLRVRVWQKLFQKQFALCGARSWSVNHC